MKVMAPLSLLLMAWSGEGAWAEEPMSDEKDTSPIFAPAVKVTPTGLSGQAPPRSRVSRELTSLLRQEATASAASGTTPSAPPSEKEASTDALQLEKMTVKGKRIVAPPLRETALEKFTRTGYLWEFSPTKRLMIGPRGDKVGLMFSLDW